MKVSELIEQLEEQRAEHGDLDVHIALFSSYPTSPVFKGWSGIDAEYTTNTWAGDVIRITANTDDW